MLVENQAGAQATAQAPAAQDPVKPVEQVQAAGQQAAPSKEATPTTAGAAAPEAPEAIDVKLPEGAVIAEEVLGKFKTIMGDRKLTVAQKAQAVLELNFQQAAAAEVARQESYKTALAQRRKDNEASLKADPEFGKAYEANVAVARRPLEKYGDTALAKELAASGLENSPVVVKFLHKLGKAMGEDSTARPDARTEEATSPEKALRARYPNSPSMFPKGAS